MRVPGFIVDHPVEGLIAAALLLALVFGSADRHAADVTHASVAASQAAAAQRM